MPKFYGPTDIMGILDVSKTTAYAIMSDLNQELKDDGFLVKKGRVSVKYFNKRYGIEEKEETAVDAVG